MYTYRKTKRVSHRMICMKRCRKKRQLLVKTSMKNFLTKFSSKPSVTFTLFPCLYMAYEERACIYIGGGNCCGVWTHHVNNIDYRDVIV